MSALTEAHGLLLRRHLATCEANPEPGGDTSVDHLAWMCRTALEHLGSHPLDKTARWEGYVAAGLAFKGLADPAEERRIARAVLGHARREAPAASPALTEAHSDLYARYLTVARANAGVGGGGPTGTTALARTCRAALRRVSEHPADALSLRLGFVQGCLICHGLADVRAERDYSRPLFHAAYAQRGEIPATLERVARV